MKKLILLTLICITQFVNGQPAQLFKSRAISSDNSCRNNFSDNALMKNSDSKLTNVKNQQTFISKKNANANNLALSQIALVDSIYFWILPLMGNPWILTNRASYTYDFNNNQTSFLYQGWNGSVSQNGDLLSYTYDANNNQTSRLLKRWNGSTWVNNSQNSLTYDANNNQTSVLNQTWISSTWVNGALSTYTYDANNNLTNLLAQDWNSGTLMNTALSSNTYDANNNLTIRLEQSWNGSAWVNVGLISNTYDANNNLTNQLYQTWIGSSWENRALDSYTYDANNLLISRLSQSWYNGAWVNGGLGSYTYDANNNLISLLAQDWDGSAWRNSIPNSYTYDANNFIQSIVYKRFEANTQTWQGDSIYYYFRTVIGVNELLAHNGVIKAYPNPFADELKIIVNGNIDKIGDAVLFDALGKEILREKITQAETIINTEKLLPGFYLLNYTDGNRSTNTKLLKF